jgi:hypothetical protein
MALNYATLIYEHAQEMFSRPITITPLASQPGAPAYDARGIYDTDEMNFMAMDGQIVSEQRTELFILEIEYPIMPTQGDLVLIPAVDDIPAVGQFEIKDASTNGGGETKLTIRKVLTAKP